MTQQSNTWHSDILPRLDHFIHNKYTDFAVILLILLAIALVVVEAGLPKEHTAAAAVALAGDLITIVFIVELLICFLVSKRRGRFFSTYWVDILAVLPLLRPLRFLRVLRLLRIFRAGVLLSRQVSFVAAIFREGFGEHIVIVVVILMIVSCASVGLVILEEGRGDDFSTLGKTFWWSVLSLVAGEPIGGMPQSLGGMIITLVVMLGGLGVFAMFTAVVTSVMVERLRLGLEVKDVELEQLNEHVLICGWNRAGRLIVEELQVDQPPGIVLIAELEEEPAFDYTHVDRGSLFWINGDYTSVSVLRRAGADRANMAILLADKSKPRSDQDRDARTIFAALIIEKLNAGIFTCAELLNRENEVHLKMGGVEEVIVGDEYSGSLMASGAINRGIVLILNELLTSRYGNQFYKLDVPDDWDGRLFKEVYGAMKEEYDAIPIAIEPLSEGESKDGPVVNPSGERPLRKGERIIYISRKRQHI